MFSLRFSNKKTYREFSQRCQILSHRFFFYAAAAAARKALNFRVAITFLVFLLLFYSSLTRWKDLWNKLHQYVHKHEDSLKWQSIFFTVVGGILQLLKLHIHSSRSAYCQTSLNFLFVFSSSSHTSLSFQLRMERRERKSHRSSWAMSITWRVANKSFTIFRHCCVGRVRDLWKEEKNLSRTK